MKGSFEQNAYWHVNCCGLYPFVLVNVSRQKTASTLYNALEFVFDI